jgi:hypothetical protein
MTSAEKILEILKSFVAVRGLALSEEKTKIINLADGFDFLSRNYRYNDGIIYATPNEAAIQKMEQNMRDLILPYRGGQKTLIEKINKKLIGWASYHRVTEAKSAFRRIDTVVKSLLLQLCEQLHPSLPRKKIISKYFFEESNGEYVYMLVNKPDVRVIRIAETILINHKPVGVNKNPYLDGEYYENRTDNRENTAVRERYKPIWTRKKGKCYYCGRAILTDEEKTLITVDPTRAETPKNQAYVHRYCSRGEMEFYDVDFDIDNEFDLYKFLQKFNGEDKNKNEKKHKFSMLEEYFRQKNDGKFTLTFDEIEKIIETPLCGSAKKYTAYWYRRGDSQISYAWLVNGYKIQKIDLEKKRVVYEKNEDFGKAIKIPDILLSGRIPVNAKQEAEIFLKHIVEKYGL